MKKLLLNCVPLTNTDKINEEVVAAAAAKPASAKDNGCRPHKSLEQLMRHPYTEKDFIDEGQCMTPTFSQKDDISAQWREFSSWSNWEDVLDPLPSWLRREILKYGEFAQATYDSFDFDPLSEYCGSCRYNKSKLFQELGLTHHGYEVTKYFYAMSRVDVPQWLEGPSPTWSKDSNWMGYLAVSNDDESRRIGRRDIVVAWRGTVAPSEWLSDVKALKEPIDDNSDVRVECGFLSMYKSKDALTKYNKLSASEQVVQEVVRLINFYLEQGDHEISLTVTGHSLGGALALLNAYETATYIPDLRISVITFGAPRVGNMPFKQRLEELRVKTLQVIIKQDIVPKIPGFFSEGILKNLGTITGRFLSVYRHVGAVLQLDLSASPFLKHKADLRACHNLEIYLHLLDGYVGKKGKFRWSAGRDLALVNKSCDMLIEELKIPKCWYLLPYKGLVLNKYGRWIKPSREPGDIPSSFSAELSPLFLYLCASNCV